MTSIIDNKTSSLYGRGVKRSTENRQSQSDRIRGRADLRDWLSAVAGIVVLSVIFELGLFGSDGSWKLVWSLLNLLPFLLIVRAVIRSLRRADEFQRRAQLEAMGIGFGTMMTAIYTAGLLETAGVGGLRQSVQISFIGSTLVWLAALFIRNR
jgi:hypothetical protein